MEVIQHQEGCDAGIGGIVERGDHINLTFSNVITEATAESDSAPCFAGVAVCLVGSELHLRILGAAIAAGESKMISA